MQYANSNGADLSAHPLSLISAFVVCCLNSIIQKEVDRKSLLAASISKLPSDLGTNH